MAETPNVADALATRRGHVPDARGRRPAPGTNRLPAPRAGRGKARLLGPLLLALALPACGGPMLLIPGGELSGEVVTEPVEDWSFVDDRFVDLETRPDDPYSVELNYVVRDGQLYIDPAEDRTWHDHIRADPNVRVRFDGRIYPVKAVLVGRPGELEGFDPDRYVYRLESRAP